MSNSFPSDLVDATIVARILREDADRTFARKVRGSEDIKATLSRIGSSGSRIPRMRATLIVNPVDTWFDVYRKQLIWNEALSEHVVEELLEEAARTPPTKDIATEQFRRCLDSIAIEPGLVVLTLSEIAETRINESRPLTTTTRLINVLESKLTTIAQEAIGETIIRQFDFIFPGRDKEAEQALNNNAGSIAFQEENGRLEIAPEEDGPRIDLKMLVADSLNDLTEPGLLNRVDNVNKRAGELVRGYAAHFYSNSPESDILLYSSGIKLFHAVSSFENPSYDEDKPPQEFIDSVKTLLVSHESFIWSIPRIREVIELRRKTVESYSSSIFDRFSLQSEILREVANADDIVGQRSRIALREFGESENDLAPIGVGTEAIQYGLLRGVLQYMGRSVVRARKAGLSIAKSTSANIASISLAVAIRADPMFGPIQHFLNSHVEQLTKLASSVQDWRWLQFVINLLHHT